MMVVTCYANVSIIMPIPASPTSGKHFKKLCTKMGISIHSHRNQNAYPLANGQKCDMRKFANRNNFINRTCWYTGRLLSKTGQDIGILSREHLIAQKLYKSVPRRIWVKIENHYCVPADMTINHFLGNAPLSVREELRNYIQMFITDDMAWEEIWQKAHAYLLANYVVINNCFMWDWATIRDPNVRDMAYHAWLNKLNALEHGLWRYTKDISYLENAMDQLDIFRNDVTIYA